MTIDVTKPLTHDDGFTRLPNILFRMNPLLDGFTLETAGLYGYLLSWRQNKAEHEMYGMAWLRQADITAETGMSAFKIRQHTEVLCRYGLLRITKSDRIANKLVYEPLEPLTYEEFRRTYWREEAAGS